MSKRCAGCGEILEKDAVFCGNCGYSVAKGMGQNSISGKKLGSSNSVAVWICCILIVLLGAVSSIGFSLRYITRTEGVSEIIDEVDFSDLRTGFISGNKKSEKLPELIQSSIPREFHSDFTEDEFEELVNKDFVKEFVAKQVSQYVDDVFKDNGDGIVEVDEIEDFLDDNKKSIHKVLGYNLDDWVYDAIVTIMEDNDVEDISDLSEYREDYSFAFNSIRIVFSYPLLILCAVLCIVLCIAVFYMNGVTPKAFRSVGVCAAVLAVIQFAVVMVLPNLKSVLSDEFPLGKDFYTVVLKPIKTQELMVGYVFLGVFVVMIGLSFVRKKLMK